MRNPTKFGSPKLDTPSLRYEFLKHAFKSRKINQKIKTSHRLTAGAHGQRDPPISETKIGDGADQREFTVGEVSDGSIYTVALYTSSHVDRCARFARKLTGGTSNPNLHPLALLGHHIDVAILI